MDVSTATARTRHPIFREVCCDACGYPRTGLANGARCPECGETAPEMVLPAHKAQQTLTVGEQKWLRTISLGMILLLVSYASALQTELVLPLEPYSLAIVNMPAPKVAAAGLIQRSLGGRPGSRGVAGTVAVLGSVLGVWLLTEARNPVSVSGSLLTIRGALRWTSVLSTGAMTGLLAAWNELPSYSADPYVTFCVLTLLLACELPVNTLLYLHLSRLAEEWGDKRSARHLKRLAAAIPVIVLGAVAMIGLERFGLRQNTVIHVAIQVAYGAIAVTVGIIAIAVTLRIGVITTSTAFEDWICRSKRALVQFPIIAGRIISNVQGNAARWSVVCGILLWLSLIPWTVSEVFWQGSRHASGGDIPYLNFIGPKVYVSSIALRHVTNYYHYSSDHDVLTIAMFQLMAIWLITRAKVGDDDRSTLRVSTRWLATIVTGIAISFAYQADRWSDSSLETHKALLQLFYTLGCEIPCTFLLYAYLASVASRSGNVELASRLRKVAIVIVVLTGLPLACFAYTRFVFIPHKLFIARSIAAILMAGSLAVGMVAITAVARLAWSLATAGRIDLLGLSSAQHDSSLARADTP